MFSGVPTWCEAGVIYCQSGVIRLCIGVLEAWDCVLPLLSHLTDAGRRRRNGGFLPFQSVQLKSVPFSVSSVKIRESEESNVSGVPIGCEAGVIYRPSGVIRLCIGVLEAWDCVLPLLSHLTDAGRRRRNGGFLPFQSVQFSSVKISSFFSQFSSVQLKSVNPRNPMFPGCRSPKCRVLRRDWAPISPHHSTFGRSGPARSAIGPPLISERV